jgi:hypothetical protein
LSLVDELVELPGGISPGGQVALAGSSHLDER